MPGIGPTVLHQYYSSGVLHQYYDEASCIVSCELRIASYRIVTQSIEMVSHGISLVHEMSHPTFDILQIHNLFITTQAVTRPREAPGGYSGCKHSVVVICFDSKWTAKFSVGDVLCLRHNLCSVSVFGFCVTAQYTAAVDVRWLGSYLHDRITRIRESVIRSSAEADVHVGGI